MKHKILLIEDDTDINHLLKRILSTAGYDTDQAFSGTEAKFYLDKGRYDLLLLDLMLPGIGGEELLKEIRQERNCQTPVIVLSAKNSLNDKVTLLENGADDYITKPFEPEEVTARVQAAIRRNRLIVQSEEQTEVLTYKNITLYPELRKVMIRKNEIALTVREYELLKLLIQKPEKVYSRESLYEQIWKEGYYGADYTVNVHISNLRRKIKEQDPSEEYLQSVYGIGFRLAKS